MDLLKLLYFPLINLGTQVLKQKLWPSVPRQILPCFNLALGLGISYGASALGLPGSGAIPPEAGHLVAEGLAIGGLATVAHNINKNLAR